MILFPAIDLYEKKAVRLTKGDYAQMTVYSDKPADVACSFRDAGATALHVVDLEGARDGTTANFETIGEIVRKSGLFTEVGGGIRTLDVVRRYIDLGIDRVVLGTAAVKEPGFVDEAVSFFGAKIAVGVDVKDGNVAVKGWTEVTDLECFAFCRTMQEKGVKTIVCTDISRDGVLGGANLDLYRRLAGELSVKIVASGGISSLKDIQYLDYINLYGAILGKALYEGRLKLSEAIAATLDKCCGG
jgi:phosphoribosylformimino-5-aminoimidazole carboxamide ribotide isomerase